MHNNEGIFYVKISSETIESGTIFQYIDSLIIDSKCLGKVYTGNSFVVFSSHECKILIRRLLSDYEAGDTSLELDPIEGLDIHELDVYISDPELNNYFINRRLCISNNHIEMVSDIVADAFNDCSDGIVNVKKYIASIDGANQYNGIHKFRQIIGIIVEALEVNANIRVGDKINEVVKETTH